MSQKIASLYAEIGADTTKLEDGLKRTKTGLKDTATTSKSTGSQLASAFTKVGLAVAGVTAAVSAVKAGFDQIMEFGRQGTELEYAAGKFDRLAEAAGTTSNILLHDLKDATKGMVSDAGLMASAGDLMALGLAKSHDEVVRLTRVAGALGMDMNQLVLTLTNQTTMRFDALGVSVDGFDEKVQKLKDSGMSASDAFKEAFLRQAEQQVTTVGDKAESTAASFQRLEVAGENLGNAWKQTYAPALAEVAGWLTKVLEGNLRMKELQEQGFSRGEAMKIQASAEAAKEYGSAQREAALAAQYAADTIPGASAAVEESAEHAENANTKWANLAPQFREVAEAAQLAAEKAQIMADASADLAGAQTALNDAQSNWKEDVGNDLGRLLEDAGLKQDIYMKALEATDDVTGTSLKPAQDLKNAQKDLIDELARTGDVEAYRKGLQELQDTFMPLNDSIVEATDLVDILQQKLLLLERGYYATVNIIEHRGGSFDFTGVPDDRGGQKVGGDMTDADFASGTTDFVVPPGYPGDTYRVGLTSGERVTVTPPGEASGAGGGVTISGPVTVIANNPDEFIRALERRAASQRRSGAYRMGQ